MRIDVQFSESNQSFSLEFGQVQKMGDGSPGAVLYNADQKLPSKSKAQARKNIDAVSSEELKRSVADVESSILEMLISLNLVSVLLDADGTVLSDADGSILLNM